MGGIDHVGRNESSGVGAPEDLSFITERDLFRERTAAIRSLLETSPVPREVADAIADGIMQFPMPWPAVWAVRSSAVGEDGSWGG